MERRPPLVDREAELGVIKGALIAAKQGHGDIVLAGGPVGIGKSRLIEETVALATEAGFKVGLGRGVVESYALYHPWFEGLRPLSLDHLLREDPPPRLLAAYLLSDSGIVVAKAERSGFSQGGAHFGIMLNNAAEFLRDAITPSGASLERDLLRFSHGAIGVVVLKAEGFGILLLLEGRETEILLQDLRRLGDELERVGATHLAEWDGNRASSAQFVSFLESFLRSGKWEGVDFAADGNARKLNLFENVLFGLRRRSQEHPLLIAIDDLQWADPSSLGLLHYLARNTRDVPVVLLGTFRTEDGRPTERLREAISTLGREELGRVLPVGPLPDAVAPSLAGAFLGRHEIEEQTMREVLRNAEGNPLFIREILQSLESTGALARDPSEGLYRLEKPAERLAIPRRMQEALAMRLDGLAGEDREALEVAAVCGTRFSGAVVAALSGEPPAKTLRRLNGIARSHDFIRAEEDGWRFGQTAVREFLYQGIAPELRRHFHREAGEIMLKAGAAPEAVGDHFALAKDSRAAPLLKEAGERALRRGAPEEATILYRRAMEFMAKTEREGMAEALAEALDLAGRGQEALKTLDDARALGLPSALWASRRARVLHRMSMSKEAVETIDAALPEAEGIERATLLAEIVPPLIFQRQFDRAKEAAAEALRLLPPQSNDKKGRMLAALAHASYVGGRAEEAEALGRQALGFLEPLEDRAGAARANRAIGNAAWVRGDLGEAEARYTASHTLSEAAGDRLQAALALANRAEVLRIRGETGLALQLNRQAIEALERVGAVRESANTRINIGSLLEMEGKHEAALASLEGGIERGRKVDDWFAVIIGLGLSPFPKIALGRSTEAIADATEAVRMSGEKGLAFLRPSALEGLAFAQVATGDLEGGRAHFAEALAGYGALQSKWAEAGAHLMWGRAEAAAGSTDEAREHLRRAEAAFAELGLERRVAEVRRELERVGALASTAGNG